MANLTFKQINEKQLPVPPVVWLIAQQKSNELKSRGVSMGTFKIVHLKHTYTFRKTSEEIYMILLSESTTQELYESASEEHHKAQAESLKVSMNLAEVSKNLQRLSDDANRAVQEAKRKLELHNKEQERIKEQAEKERLEREKQKADLEASTAAYNAAAAEKLKKEIEADLALKTQKAKEAENALKGSLKDKLKDDNKASALVDHEKEYFELQQKRRNDLEKLKKTTEKLKK